MCYYVFGSVESPRLLGVFASFEDAHALCGLLHEKDGLVPLLCSAEGAVAMFGFLPAGVFLKGKGDKGK